MEVREWKGELGGTGKPFCEEEGCLNLAYMAGLCKDHLVLILRRKVKGTEIWVYSAWVPTELMGAHTTITFVEGEPFGKVGTLTNTEEEFEAAYILIEDEYPEAKNGERDAGEITLWEVEEEGGGSIGN